MIIFNITYLVSDKIYGKWYKWLHEELIPEVLSHGYFINPKVAKILYNDSEDGSSYSVQFETEDINLFTEWSEKYGSDFAMKIKEQFGEDILYFPTVMEVLK